FTNQEGQGTKDDLYISYPNFHKDVQVGESILLDDGKIETQVVAVTPEGQVQVRVINGGVLLPRKGVNLPQTNISLPSLTEKDLRDLDFIIKQKIDWIALSFVRKPNDIIHLRTILQEKNSKAKIIAKIEKPEAIAHLREIILAS